LAGLAVGVAFLRRQRRLADPLIDLRLFRAPAFSASLAVYTLGILVLFGTFFFIFQYLQLVLELSPLVAGLWTLPAFASFVVGSMVAPMLVRRVRPAFVMAAGLAAGGVGFLILAQLEAVDGLPVLVTASVVYSLGLAPLFTLTNDLIIGAAPPERAGAASGI
jgi:MFS transporter, DHA2 family, multidrug resistance protein